MPHRDLFGGGVVVARRSAGCRACVCLDIVWIFICVKEMSRARPILLQFERQVLLHGHLFGISDVWWYWCKNIIFTPLDWDKTRVLHVCAIAPGWGQEFKLCCAPTLHDGGPKNRARESCSPYFTVPQHLLDFLHLPMRPSKLQGKNANGWLFHGILHTLVHAATLMMI